ncbi:penicillin-binding transpeptidase domain-containing protein [Luminiphilus sp.]|jgi:cell division protein FtsI (penicillin-binding protein 3)|nr:penicillin-binding transpeptidase domain-containing protein [Luminiphilus sp.]
MSRGRPPVLVYRWRIALTAAVLAGLFGMLVVRLVQLQVGASQYGAHFLQRQGDLRTVRSAEIPAYRGLITDRRGAPLAISTPVVTLWTNPQELRGSGRESELAALMNLAPKSFEARLNRYRNKQFMYLARHQTPQVASAVMEAGLPGVYGKREYRRFYPAGEVVSQLVGTTNIDGAGATGVELLFDASLQGRTGKKQFIKALHGESIRDIGVVEEAADGQSLQLSIDLRLQHVQHRELLTALGETGAAAASAVTIDAQTGEVLAMTNLPSFNPNRRGQLDLATMRNRVATDVFEPGSTVKPLTLVAALESGDFDIDTLVDTSPGRITVGGKVLPDPRNYGEITLSRVIEKSSQVGVTKIAQAIGHERIIDVFQRFGLGQLTGAEFPGERSGRLPDHDFWSAIDRVTPAFGYGLLVTPLQLAHAYAILANQGRMVPLTLLASEGQGAAGRQIISPEIAEEVVTVLHRVTGREGTAQRASVAGFNVGGKTGTIHKVGATGYLDDRYVALFVGVAPIEAPRYVTVVVIDEPKGDAYGGGAAAAPVYSRITQEVLRIQSAVPTDSDKQSPVKTVAMAGRDNPRA